MTVRVSAVVVNYEQRELLRSCLKSLTLALGRVEGGYELIVVDNGSSDGSAQTVRNEFPEVRLVELGSNAGFAGGMSAGIGRATGEWVFSINNDASVAPDTVVELLRVAQASGPNVGSVAAQMVFADRPDVINSAGILVDRLGVASDRLLGEKVATSEREPIEVFGTSAGAALYRKEMLDGVPFEPTFFAYYEDVDVAWRARMRGWRCLYAPDALVHHHHSATSRHGSSFKYYWSGRNRIRVLARNATLRQLLQYGVGMVAYDLGYIAVALAFDRSLAPIRGRIDGLQTWRTDRRACAGGRRAVKLASFLGFRAAIRRLRSDR